MIMWKVGPKVASLKPAVIAAARRTGAAYWAIAALGAMRASLSGEEREVLKRVYRSECGSRDCEPFSQAIAAAFRRTKR
jgi:alkylhydroperoxidase family enzyme